mmetsp:Transcript_26850/g.52550  ORF Transcript_26850/g.52550 Transcript_26850/m.52550 type:complete len:216 (-) Transcript_26850:67-714(-)
MSWKETEFSLEHRNCKRKGSRVHVPSCLGKNGWPAIISITELLPELSCPTATIIGRCIPIPSRSLPYNWLKWSTHRTRLLTLWPTFVSKGKKSGLSSGLPEELFFQVSASCLKRRNSLICSLRSASSTFCIHFLIASSVATSASMCSTFNKSAKSICRIHSKSAFSSSAAASSSVRSYRLLLNPQTALRASSDGLSPAARAGVATLDKSSAAQPC